jgi:hypothetical protein
MEADETFFRPLTLWDDGTVPFQFSRGRYPIGANMAFRMATLQHDPFDPRYGHTGQVALGFDEWELFDRLIDTHIVMYQPQAVVNHWLDTSRLSFRAVRTKMFQYGVGEARYYNAKKSLPPYPRRFTGASRAAARVVVARIRTRRDGLNAPSAVADLKAFRDAGGQMETLLASWPRLSQWIARAV